MQQAAILVTVMAFLVTVMAILVAVMAILVTVRASVTSISMISLQNVINRCIVTVLFDSRLLLVAHFVESRNCIHVIAVDAP